MWGFVLGQKTKMIEPGRALVGRTESPAKLPAAHHALGTPLGATLADGEERAYFALGCFWGAERVFWRLDGVRATTVGYAGGFTPHPTYEEVCSGRTGHTEVVEVIYDPPVISYAELLRVFWESHDPSQGMRQGNDIGTQYRSAIYTTSEAQRAEALRSRDAYQAALSEAGRGPITTEIEPAPTYYYAEAYHQQYLSKNPNGYCGLGGTGVACPIGSGVEAP